MPTSTTDLKTWLGDVRSQLQTDVPNVDIVYRDAQPIDDETGEFEAPDSPQHIILDLVPGAPSETFDGSIIDDLSLQVGAWSDVGITAALALAESARASLNSIDLSRESGITLTRDGRYRGVIATYSIVAAFDVISI